MCGLYGVWELRVEMATKSRFSATDVKAMVRDLRSLLLGQRVANVYNVTDKTYLFKFAIPGSSEKVRI
jgi:predicted ribosome quality control (RQC) complex YloA/Tae2 family protein